jgi:superfamily I DNA/RNA helicase
VVDEIQRLLESGTPSPEICVVGRTARQYKGIKEELSQRGMDSVIIEREAADNPQIPGIRFANMHRIKGLEFRVVFVVGVRKGVVPLEYALTATKDPVEKRARDLNERALMHVAATRAVNGLYVTWWGERSELVRVGS